MLEKGNGYSCKYSFTRLSAAYRCRPSRVRIADSRALCHVGTTRPVPHDLTVTLDAMPLGPSREHGSIAGHSQHRRHGETACEPCKAARRAYDRGWQAAAAEGAPIQHRARPDCGSEAAYKAHRRRGEVPCGSCREARNARRRELAADRKIRK